MDLPHRVRLTPLKMHYDERGWVSEIFRDEWGVTGPLCQWNVGFSQPNSLRGLHLHLKHEDYFTTVKGDAVIGLCDVRPKSPTYRKSALIELTDRQLAALTVPRGVLHAVYSPDASVHVYGADCYYDPSDDLACRWDDPALGIAWPCRDPILNERDRSAGTLAELEATLRRMDVAFD